MAKKDFIGDLIDLTNRFVHLIASAVIPEAMEKKDEYLRRQINDNNEGPDGEYEESDDDYNGFPVDDRDEVQSYSHNSGPF